jgi:hypothetical protein
MAMPSRGFKELDLYQFHEQETGVRPSLKRSRVRGPYKAELDDSALSY